MGDVGQREGTDVEVNEEDDDDLDGVAFEASCSSCQKTLPRNAFSEGRRCCIVCLSTRAQRRDKARHSNEDDSAENTKLCTTCFTNVLLQDFESGFATCRRCLNRKRKGYEGLTPPPPGQARCSTCRKEQPESMFNNGKGTCRSCLERMRSSMQRPPAVGMAKCSSCRKEQPEGNFMKGRKTCSKCLEHKRAKRKKPSTETEAEQAKDDVDLVGIELYGWLQTVDEDDRNDRNDVRQVIRLLADVDDVTQGSGADTVPAGSSGSGSGSGSTCQHPVSVSCTTTDDDHLAVIIHIGLVYDEAAIPHSQASRRITVELSSRWRWFVFPFLLISYWVFIVPYVPTLKEMHWSTLPRIIISAVCWLLSWCVAGFIIGSHVTYACYRHGDAPAAGSKVGSLDSEGEPRAPLFY